MTSHSRTHLLKSITILAVFFFEAGCCSSMQRERQPDKMTYGRPETSDTLLQAIRLDQAAMRTAIIELQKDLQTLRERSAQNDYATATMLKRLAVRLKALEGASR